MAEDTDVHASALIQLREFFRSAQYEEVVSSFEEMGDTKSIRSGIRVEALSLAARAQIALGNKKLARELLKREWGRDMKSPRLYGYLAMAALELGEYDKAAALAANAASLKDEQASA